MPRRMCKEIREGFLGGGGGICKGISITVRRGRDQQEAHEVCEEGTGESGHGQTGKGFF